MTNTLADDVSTWRRIIFSGWEVADGPLPYRATCPTCRETISAMLLGQLDAAVAAHDFAGHPVVI